MIKYTSKSIFKLYLFVINITKTLKKMGKIISLKGGINKGKFFVISICLLFAMESWAQNSAKTTVKVLENSSSKLRIQIKPGDYVAETVYRNKTNFVSVAVDGFGTAKVSGYPELPQYQTLINIPVCDGMTYKVTKTNEITMPLHISGYPMLPAQPSRSKSDKSPVVFVKNAKMYSQNRFWNPGDAKVEKLGVMRNTSIARLEMSPFSYNPVTGQIKKATSMEIEITFKNPNVQATKGLFNKYKDVYAGNIQNSMLNQNIYEAKDAHVTGPLHYVIVSNIAFQTALQPFVTWKKKQGYIVTEAYTNNSAVGTTTTSIKAYLKGLYTNATTALPAPTFVLLVGDVAQIPAFSGTTGTHPSDLYYCTWTTGDNLPDAYYGRWSGTTAQHITNQVDKTVEYEKYLMADPSFLNNFVAVAGVADGYDDLYGDGQVNYVNNYFSATPFTVYSYPSAVSSQSSASASIISKVNAGVSIANYSAHGDWDCWYDPSFTTTNVASMTNAGKYPVMMGNCCLSNKFNATGGDCFGEALLKAQNKGAVGYIGASNSSYWDEDFYFACGYKTVSLTAAYNASNLGSFDRLFHTHGEAYSAQYITTGQMLNAGDLAVVQSGSTRTLYYLEIYHLMGDPSLMPFLGVPTTFTPTYPATLPLNSTTIAVSNIPPYAYVGVTMGSTLLGATFADATGVANVPLSGVTTSGTADIVITAQNKVPHFGTITIGGTTVCATPTALTATSITQTSANLGWTSTAANFKVRYRTVGATAWTTTTTASNPLSVTGLTANTQYQFQVQAVCSATAGDTSAWATAINFTTIANCNAPTALVVSSISESSATLNWTAGGTETAWNIRYKKTADATYTNVANTSTKPYILTGLLSNTAYLWNVQAICSSVTSAWSVDNSFTTISDGIENNSLSGLSVYSYNDKVNVMNNGNIIVKEVVIYDVIGQEVGKYQINSTDNILINANLNTGNYIVKIVTSQKVGTYKLFIKSLK